MTLFCGLLCLLGLGSWLVRYPDIVTAAVYADSHRRTAYRGGADGGQTGAAAGDGRAGVERRDRALAYSESTADPTQVLALGTSLAVCGSRWTQSDWAAMQRYSIRPYNQLGELQNDFSTFYQQLTQLKSYLSGGFLFAKKDIAPARSDRPAGDGADANRAIRPAKTRLRLWRKANSTSMKNSTATKSSRPSTTSARK